MIRKSVPGRSASFILLICLTLTLNAQTTLPMTQGKIAATCFSEFTDRYNENTPINPDGFVLGITDPTAPKSGFGYWPQTLFHNETGEPWTAENLGQVFGIALDDASPPNIYVTATAIYGRFLDSTGAPDPSLWGPGGAGGVYKIHGTTGAITVLASLPNSGPGLGNICYDPASKNLYISNFEDGLIYGMDCNGNPLPATYDHGLANLAMADDGVQMDPSYASNNTSAPSGFTQVGRRVWGVQVFNGKLYYSIWGQDNRRQEGSNQIWSVGLDSAGRFTGPGMLEITMPLISSSFSNPVSDIAFSSTGDMLTAEKTMNRDVGDFSVSSASGHLARVFEFKGGSGIWGAPTQIRVGPPGSNAEGGVSYGSDFFENNLELCDGSILLTGEQITGTATEYAYGIQISPPGGPKGSNPWDDSYGIDLDNLVARGDVLIKSRIGDVEALQSNCFPEVACLDILEQVITCVKREGDQYYYELQISIFNNSPFNSALTQLDLESATPGIANLPTTVSIAGVGPGDASGVIKIPFTMTDGQPGDFICIDIKPSTLDSRGKVIWCCPKQTLCIQLPECQFPCFSGRVKYNCETGKVDFLINNDGAFDAHRVQLIPHDANSGFAPQIHDLTPPLPPGQTTTISLDYTPGLGARPQVLASIHGPIDPRTGVADCCFLEIVLPNLADNDCPYRPIGCVYFDTNGNGVQEDSEEGLPGWTVYAEGPQGEIATTVTDERGLFSFESYQPGIHYLTLRVQEGYTHNSDNCTFKLNFAEPRTYEPVKWPVISIATDHP